MTADPLEASVGLGVVWGKGMGKTEQYLLGMEIPKEHLGFDGLGSWELALVVLNLPDGWSLLLYLLSSHYVFILLTGFILSSKLRSLWGADSLGTSQDLGLLSGDQHAHISGGN